MPNTIKTISLTDDNKCYLKNNENLSLILPVFKYNPLNNTVDFKEFNNIVTYKNNRQKTFFFAHDIDHLGLFSAKRALDRAKKFYEKKFTLNLSFDARCCI